MVAQHGAQLTKDVARLGLGKRPQECWVAIAEALQLQVPAQQLVEESEPELQAQCACICFPTLISCCDPHTCLLSEVAAVACPQHAGTPAARCDAHAVYALFKVCNLAQTCCWHVNESFADSGLLACCRWPHVKMLPGAKRLLLHLRSHGVPAAIATSTPRSSFALKAMHHPELGQCCQACHRCANVDLRSNHPL